MVRYLIFVMYLVSSIALAGEYGILGDPKTKLYYIPLCPGYNELAQKQNRRLFSDIKEAKSSGYKQQTCKFDFNNKNNLNETLPEKSPNASPDYSTHSYRDNDSYRSTGENNYGGGKTVHVRSYTRKDGTYVRSHYRSSRRR